MADLGAVQTWLVLGLILVGIEFMSGTFVMLLLGVACFATALTAHLGLVTSIQGQLFMASGFGVLSLLLFRKQVRSAWAKMGLGKYEVDTGEVLVLASDLPARGSCEVNYQGTTWTAVNESSLPFHAGDSVRIIRSEGIKLIVSEIKKN